MFNSIPISCNQAKDFPRGGARQAGARRVLFANVIGPPLFCSTWCSRRLFSRLSVIIFASFFPCFPVAQHSSPHTSVPPSFLPFPSSSPLPSFPVPSPLGEASVVVIVISYFLLIPASAASGHWLQNPLSFVYFNYANEDSSAGLLEAAGEKAGTPLRVITIHPLVSL